MKPEDVQFATKLLKMYDEIVTGLEALQRRKNQRINEIYAEHGVHDILEYDGPSPDTPEFRDTRLFQKALRTIIKHTEDARSICNNIVLSNAPDATKSITKGE